MPVPDQALPCGFPFEGPTAIAGIFLGLPGSAAGSPDRWLILRMERCSAPFPFEEVIVDRDNSSRRGENAEDENLAPAWAKAEKTEGEVETEAPDTFRSNEEPRRGLDPLKVDLVEDRFEDLRGKKLLKEEKFVQRFRHSPMKMAASKMLTGLGTGQGTWGTSNLQVWKHLCRPSNCWPRKSIRCGKSGLSALAMGTRVWRRIPWRVFRFVIRASGKGSHGLGSKRRTAQGGWPLLRSARKTRLHTHSKSSGTIRRRTQFSYWHATICR